MKIKKGIYRETISPKKKTKLVGELRAKMAIRLERSDKAQQKIFID